MKISIAKTIDNNTCDEEKEAAPSLSSAKLALQNEQVASGRKFLSKTTHAYLQMATLTGQHCPKTIRECVSLPIDF